MDTLLLFGFLFLIFCIISLILPWFNRNAIEKLQQEMRQVNLQLSKIHSTKDMPIPTQPPLETPLILEMPHILETPHIIEKKIENKPEAKPIMKSFNIEQQLGARLPIWIGSIAMALAGFFLVKYSIAAGLLTVKVRIVLGIIFGLCLLLSASWIRNRSTLSNNLRIAQALSGAGIADLYICIFAATTLYHLFPVLLGFIGMAIITLIAVILSLRHGAPIALLGLLGGLLTPALIHTGTPNAILLFSYLYFVMLGIFIVLQKKAWWFLAFFALIGAFLWVGIWLYSYYSPGDSLWLGLFLIAVSSTFIATTTNAFEASPKATQLSLNYLAMGGATVLMGITVYQGQFAGFDWLLFALLAVEGIALAYFKQKLYGFVPLLLMLVNAVMLLTWDHPDPILFMTLILGFAVLYTASGYLFFWRAPSPTLWIGLSGSTSIIYYLIAYFRLYKHPIMQPAVWNSVSWSSIAFALALLAIIVMWRILNNAFENKLDKQRILTILILTTVAFLSIGFTIALEQRLLPLTFAAQVLAISWINNKVDIKSLPFVAAILTGIFILLLLPQLLIFIQLILNSLVAQNLYFPPSLSMTRSPFIQLGIPVLLLGSASCLFRFDKDSTLVNALEIITMLLISIMGYCVIRNLIHHQANWLAVTASFMERGIITNFFCAFAMICLYSGYYFSRPKLITGGSFILAMAISRIIYFDLISYNPLFSQQFVGQWPVLNGLLLPYGLPLLWIFLANKILPAINKLIYSQFNTLFSLLLFFVLLSLEIRQFYQGGFLNSGTASNAEIYNYSIIWLLMGVGLLLAGTLRHDKTFRIASLLVIAVTIAKVFLYDASALTGLYRVFSFFGLGVCLIALSWFYSRFVFRETSVGIQRQN